MNFILPLIVYLVLGALLAMGIVAVVKGSLWLLAIGTLVYVLLFAVFGCLPPKSHH